MRFYAHAPALLHVHPQMAHYSSDCWDAEVETSYGWVECVGLAYRGAYDLTVHSKASKIDLNAHEKFAEPRMVEQFKVGGAGMLTAVFWRCPLPKEYERGGG
eukprot:224530-Chlamydomonas_euryale.AAC.1